MCSATNADSVLIAGHFTDRPNRFSWFITVSRSGSVLRTVRVLNELAMSLCFETMQRRNYCSLETSVSSMSLSVLGGRQTGAETPGDVL